MKPEFEITSKVSEDQVTLVIEYPVIYMKRLRLLPMSKEGARSIMGLSASEKAKFIFEEAEELDSTNADLIENYLLDGRQLIRPINGLEA